MLARIGHIAGAVILASLNYVTKIHLERLSQSFPIFYSMLLHDVVYVATRLIAELTES